MTQLTEFRTIAHTHYPLIGAADALNGWFVEPQLSNETDPSMVDISRANNNIATFGSKQAVNVDYTRSGYDRGHLNQQLYHCETNDRARRYFITGVLQSENKFISNGRVNIPSHYWTAVCCDSSGAMGDLRKEGWSAGFIGENKNTSPTLKGLVGSTQICQRLGNQYYYATEYDTTNRIPYYSAYTLSFDRCGHRYNGWFVEPQLADNNDPSMVDY
ncbi:unnamed protein product [Mytilus edulis]|uniref:Uncharacterized protein n=1 Tax=Mytilus edulis TaxID=6550 RepID=A0A8S3QIM0_MYTED|nr:unnamed protein product [Mytilus edulis]